MIYDFECTGVAASWCHNCGDCTCPDMEDKNSPFCDLHKLDGDHGSVRLFGLEEKARYAGFSSVEEFLK